MAIQAQGCAPPPQVADVAQKTTLFCSTRAGPGKDARIQRYLRVQVKYGRDSVWSPGFRLLK